ncbi:hypothetical protein HYQ43_18460 [Paracoccus pantotrophus]|jgi:hypothetical protein|uniref:Uncharacterized protein n=3 Tax=Alphaproteobacteria TaxID=28211 RepID=A0A7H9BYL8_PARPN|nr:hypothetical protein HYQ43_18460 [Paracoccus pantotrophus]
MGFLETMALKRSRINIEVFGPPASSEPARNGGSRADEAVMILTRLLGRQIAREQFERKLALERRVQKKRPAGEDA